jgi:hypothetical protein
MDRLFRDWRFALLWVVGISALAAAFFARGGGHEELLAKPQPEASATAPAPAASPAPVAAPAADAEDEQEKFGEPVMDTTGFEPSPPEPDESASASPQATSAPAPEEQ